MAVSYLSNPVQSSPYVAPLDLGLMAKVLSVKQGQFDAEAQKIQSQVDTIASTDLMRGVDKDYVNSRLNTIVNNINSLGGVDLSNHNISNQISGYASSVYNDDKVISAISSTKRARALMGSYEKMKSDPKLMRYYSEANEYADTKHLNAWMKDPNAGSSYSGPSTATRYSDYNQDFTNVFKNIIPQQYTKLTTGNGYIEKETGKVLSEKRVYEIAQGMLNPVQRDQMQRDATYLYEAKAGYGKEQMVGKVLQHRNEELEGEKDVLRQLRAAMVEANPVEKAKISKMINEKTNYINSLSSTKDQEAAYYSSLYDTNPQEVMYRAYSDDYFKSIGKRYAINQVDKTLTADPVKLEQFRQSNLNARQNKEIKAAQSLQGQKDTAAWERAVLDSDTKIATSEIRSKDKDKDGNTTADPFGAGNITDNKSQQKLDERREIAQKRMFETTQQMNSIKDDYVNRTIAENPALTKEDAANSFNLLASTMAEKSVMKDGLVKNLPAGFGDKLEQYNLLQHQHQTLQKAAFLGQFSRPQYLTKVITPDDQNNVKDPNYRTFEAIKTQLKNDGKINDTKDVVIKEIYAAGEDEGGGFKATYVEGDGKKQSGVKTIDLTPSQASALGYVEPPNGLGILNRTVDTGNDFVTYVQNSQDPNFVAKVRVYKIKDGEYGAQYMYSHGVPINILKSGNAGSPAEAYRKASEYIKRYPTSDISQNKYATKLKFEKDLGVTQQIPAEERSNHAPVWSQEELNRYKVGNFK